jgi:hypothetical protein
VVAADQRNYARSFLKKAEEYLASAEDNLAADRNTPPPRATRSTPGSVPRTPS